MKISVLQPTSIGNLDPADTSIGEAIYSIYKNNETPIVEILWNDVRLEIDGISLSKLIFDIWNTLSLLRENRPTFDIYFFDNAFTTNWHFSSVNDELHIYSQWTVVKGFTSKNGKLHKLQTLTVDTIKKNDLIVSFEQILRQIRNDLCSAGYSESLEDFHYLII